MIINGSLNYDIYGRRKKSTPRKRTNRQGAVAQMGERRVCTAKVAGSTPVSSTKLPEYTPAEDTSYKKKISSKYTVAIAYNKGAYQVIPKSDIKDIGK